MCGVAGIFAPGRSSSLEAVHRLVETLNHRGPDGRGVWLDADAGVALGHTRLAIIDLSEAGRQPMTSANDRWVVAFNGEIFNFETIRAELDARSAIPWRGRSDTEVIVEGFAEWGIEATLRRMEGQFAICAWDRKLGALHLIRDRFGEKPLYYGWANQAFVFGSELKSLRAAPGFSTEIDPAALSSFVRYGYVRAPRSIYKNARKVMPGEWLTIGDQAEFHEPRSQFYWDPARAIETARARPFEGSAADVTRELDKLLRDTVRARMVSDVPLGAFLSGGIDSSLIVALMQAQSSRKVKTFTIGNSIAALNEADHARAVAKHLGTDHTELYVSGQDALNVVPLLPRIYDEPFGDSSQIPTFLVSQLARQSVTVALSGDGGDELFGGYNRYFHGARILRRVEALPGPVRRAAASGLRWASPDRWDQLVRLAGPLAPQELRAGRAGEKLHKLAGVLDATDHLAFHESLLSLSDDTFKSLRSDHHTHRISDSLASISGLDDFASRAMYLDTHSYLADDILTKVDRASMAVSLESRAPLLDTQVFDFAWRLPTRMKLGAARGKLPLRAVLDQYVPNALIERPKQGFSVPVSDWLRTDLRDWGENLLDERRLREQGLLDVSTVRRFWQEHQSGRRNRDAQLWALLMLQAWLEETGSELYAAAA
jgi:asparagine synthase (glutamine-hydrolysing)